MFYVPSSRSLEMRATVTTSSWTPSSSRGPFSSPCSSSSPSWPSSWQPCLPPVGSENVLFPSLSQARIPTPPRLHRGGVYERPGEGVKRRPPFWKFFFKPTALAAAHESGG